MAKVVKSVPSKEVLVTVDELLIMNVNDKILVSVYDNKASVAFSEGSGSGTKSFFTDLRSCLFLHTTTRGYKNDLVLRIMKENLLGENQQYYVFDSQKEFFQAAVDNGWD